VDQRKTPGCNRGKGSGSDSTYIVGTTLPETNIAMENGPFEDVLSIKNSDIP